LRETQTGNGDGHDKYRSGDQQAHAISNQGKLEAG
jgi:hypothetical protein